MRCTPRPRYDCCCELGLSVRCMQGFPALIVTTMQTRVAVFPVSKGWPGVPTVPVFLHTITKQLPEQRNNDAQQAFFSAH